MPGNQGRVEPAVTYYRCMELYCITADGAICTVENCPAGAFRVLAQVAAQTAKRPETALSALSGLNYAYTIDRWYAVTTLRDNGAAIPLFATESEAKQAKKP